MCADMPSTLPRFVKGACMSGGSIDNLRHSCLLCSLAVSKAAAIALGLTLPKLHPADAQGKEAAKRQLIGYLMDPRQAGSLRAACGEALGLAISGLSNGISDEVCSRPLRVLMMVLVLSDIWTSKTAKRG